MRTTPPASNSSAARPRKMPASSPIENPIVATNSPMATNETARPAANAAGPSRCSERAAPRTSGNSGRTQGDSVDRTPAKSASRPALFAITSSSFGRGGLDEGCDRASVGIADRASHLGLAPVRDQGALALRAELSDNRLLAVEIDREDHEILVRWLLGKRIDDRLLRLAGRAPCRRNINENARTTLLRRLEACSVKRLAFRCAHRGHRQPRSQAPGERRNEEQSSLHHFLLL